jgi:hypothetical protein
MTKTCLGVLLAFASLGCSSDSAPGANVAMDVTLANSPLARMQNVSLIRAGDSFTLAGYEDGLVRWGRLSPNALDGQLAYETSFAPPELLVGPAPVFAATMKKTPGDQLVAIGLTNSPTVNGGYNLSAIVQTMGDALPAAPVVLATIEAGIDPNTVQIVAGAATSGNLGFVAWGIPVKGRTVNYLLLTANAQHAATASEVFDHNDPASVPNWQCLTAPNGSSGISLGVVIPQVDTLGNIVSSEFRVFDIDEAGAKTDMTYPLSAAVTNCHIVGSPSPEGGYLMAFESSAGIGFATYTPSPDPAYAGNVTTKDMAMPVATLGGPLNIQPPAWVSSASGGDVSIGLSRTAGPEVFRFTYNATHHGGTLTLRSEQGNTGPVASWVGSDAVFVTYADQVSGSPLVKRYFMRIESPATLP